jgi:hypothetical protein
MAEFKVGDKVRLVYDNGNAKMTVGKIYTIMTVYKDRVNVYNDNDILSTLCSYRFTLVEPLKNYHPVSKPSHYNLGDGVECITYIKQVLGKDGFVAYCRGNVMKYNHRAMYKGNPLEDMAKAQQYLEWANETLKEIHK